MRISELLANSTLLQEARFFRTLDKRQRVAAANPALNAAYRRRDGATGQMLATTPDGGTVRAAYISNASLGKGDVLPAINRGNGGSGFADIKPV